jgi:protein-disulfide isomerase
MTSRRAVLLGAAAALAGRAPAWAAAPQRVPVELYEEALELDGAIRVGAGSAGANGGGPYADVTMVEFFDYNCPYCRRSAADLPALLAGDPNLAYVLVNYAVLGAPSVEASRVALAVYDLHGPQRALAFHERLFAQRGRLDAGRAFDAARDLGLDVGRLAAAADADRITRWMTDAARLGASLGLVATPSFLVGPEAVVGGLSLEGKRALIDRARA